MTGIYLLTPSYNSEEFIELTFESVLTQETNSPVYYHVQDGASTDNTLTLINKWKKIFDQTENIRFSFNSVADKGMYHALNTGFTSFTNVPNNAFMGWINSDDILYPHTLQTVINASLNPEATWVHGRASCIDKDGKKVYSAKIIYPQYFVANGLADGYLWYYLQQEGCFFRKTLWDSVGGCDASFRLAGDWDLWRRMAQITPPILINRTLASFRYHTGQLSSNMAEYHKEIDNTVPVLKRKLALKKIAFSSMPVSILQDDNSICVRQNTLRGRLRCVVMALGLYPTINNILRLLPFLRKKQ